MPMVSNRGVLAPMQHDQEELGEYGLPLGKPLGTKASVGGERPQSEGRIKTRKVEEALWAIYDRQTGRPYIQRGWPKEEAEREMAHLLEPYSEDSPWRKRFFLAGYQRGSKRKAASEEGS